MNQEISPLVQKQKLEFDSSITRDNRNHGWAVSKILKALAVVSILAVISIGLYSGMRSVKLSHSNENVLEEATRRSIEKTIANVSLKPTTKPTQKLTGKPVAVVPINPSAKPTAKPTAKQIVSTTTKPTAKKTIPPTTKPTAKQTVSPTAKPTVKPSMKPISLSPTALPTSKPKQQPTSLPVPTTSVPTTGIPACTGPDASVTFDTLCPPTGDDNSYCNMALSGAGFYEFFKDCAFFTRQPPLITCTEFLSYNTESC